MERQVRQWHRSPTTFLPSMLEGPSSVIDTVSVLPAPPLLLLRGLPGTGKTTLAHGSFARWAYLDADAFMLDKKGQYRWTASKAPESHKRCQDAMVKLLRKQTPVIIANTFTRRWEIYGYLQKAGEVLHDWPETEQGDCLIVHLLPGTLTDHALAQRTVHNVPEAMIALMRTRWEPAPGEWLLASQG